MSMSGTLSAIPTGGVKVLTDFWENFLVGETDHPPYLFCQYDGMTDLEHIGKRIAALRNDAGMTQDQLAVEIGISRSTLAGIERGKDRAGILSTMAIADYFKVPMDWLLGRSVPPGGPLTGDFVYRLDELAWIAFWRNLEIEDRRAAVKLLRVPGITTQNAA